MTDSTNTDAAFTANLTADELLDARNINFGHDIVDTIIEDDEREPGCTHDTDGDDCVFCQLEG